jgi:hypothetical protein
LPIGHGNLGLRFRRGSGPLRSGGTVGANLPRACLRTATRFYWCVGPSYGSRHLTLKVSHLEAVHSGPTWVLSPLRKGGRSLCRRLTSRTDYLPTHTAICAARIGGRQQPTYQMNGSTYDRFLELYGNTFGLGAMPVRAGLAQSLHSLTFRPKAQRLTRYGETQV